MASLAFAIGFAVLQLNGVGANKDVRVTDVRLDNSFRLSGTLSRSYRAQVEAGAAKVEKDRKRAIDKPGVYEFVFLVGPAVKQGALSYGGNRPDVARVPIDSFRVPWP
jgi:hypothetical protein